MNHRHAALPLALAAMLTGTAAAHAQITTPARDSIATISYSDLTFANARMQIDATQTIGAGSTGTKNVTFSANPSLESYALSSTGGVTVGLNGFTPPASFDVGVSATGAGTWSIAERFSASDDIYGDGPLYRYTADNDFLAALPALELTLFVGGLVDIGGSFGVGFVIPGQWTPAGTDILPGTLAYQLDPDWAIDTPFVYDAAANVTRFHATNPSYEGVGSAHPSPFLDVLFFGAVPEPATWATMILGFGAVGVALRRRRLPAAAPARA